MNTDIQSSDVESVTMSDILQLTSTWDRPRSSEELQGFIARRETALADAVDE
jgi:hypothetical protein